MRIVEAFLYALRDKQWDTFASAMDDNIVYHNVGTPTIKGRQHFWVCGVFEVDNDQITLWRDYFDIFDMIKAGVRAVAGTAIPSLRPSL